MKRGLVLVLILVMLSSSVLSLSFVSPSYCDIEGTVTSIDFNEAGCHEDEIWEELSGCWENYYRLHLNVTKSVGISDKVVENKYADITCEERLGEDSDISVKENDLANKEQLKIGSIIKGQTEGKFSVVTEETVIPPERDYNLLTIVIAVSSLVIITLLVIIIILLRKRNS